MKRCSMNQLPRQVEGAVRVHACGRPGSWGVRQGTPHGAVGMARPLTPPLSCSHPMVLSLAADAASCNPAPARPHLSSPRQAAAGGAPGPVRPGGADREGRWQLPVPGAVRPALQVRQQRQELAWDSVKIPVSGTRCSACPSPAHRSASLMHPALQDAEITYIRAGMCGAAAAGVPR